MSLRNNFKKTSSAIVPTPAAPTSTQIAAEPKSLRPARSTTIARPNGAGTQAIKNALLRTAPPTKKPDTNIGFIIDATASRQDTWDTAQKTQAAMLSELANGFADRVTIELVTFGGDVLNAPTQAVSHIDAAKRLAEVECKAGSTQFIDALQPFVERKDNRTKSIIIVGDFFEENIETVYDVARKLAQKKIKIFTFQEGHYDNDDTETFFRELARITGGAYAKFGSPVQLSKLCADVIDLTLGGCNALRALNKIETPQTLLAQAKRPALTKHDP